MGIRQDRIANVIQKEVSEMIEFQVREDGLGFVTVSGVHLSNDYSFCKIYVSFLDQSKGEQAQLEILSKHAKRFRGLLGKKLMIRKIPEIQFEIDQSFKEGRRIDELLNELKK